MAAFTVLVIATLALRFAGLLGVRGFTSWKSCVRYALAAMFVFTGISHFTDLKHDFARMIPPPLPQDLRLIYLSGALEFAGAIGLLVSRTQRIAGVCLALLLVALFPANVYAAQQGVLFRGEPPTELWLRAALQLTYIAAIWWAVIRSGSVRSRSAATAGTVAQPGSRL